MNVYIPYTRLPSEYQEVEYIQTSGTQFIDTGITPQSNIQIETKVSVVTTSQNLPVFGNYVDNSVLYTSGDYYHLTCYSSKWYWGLNGSESNGGTYSPTVGTQYEIIYNNSDNQVLVNGSSLGSSSGTAGYTGTTLAISVRGNNYTNNKFYGQYKYYYFNVFNKTTGEYERQMIPCYRKSDGVIGMYDLVNSVFYTNAGTGTFSKGSDVNMVEAKNIYIGEYKGWKPGANTLLYLPLESDTNDHSPNPKTITLNGTVTQDTIGYNFNGGYLVSSAFTGPTNYTTLSAWVKPNSTRSNYQAIVSKYYGSFTYPYATASLGIPDNTSNISFEVTDSSATQNELHTSFTMGSWQLITGTYDGSNLKLYINGQMITSSAGSWLIYSNNTQASIGNYLGVTQLFYGNLSEVIFENRAWTAEQVAGYYNQTKSNYGL